MHEASLVRSLLNQVERLREAHRGLSVEQIDVEIGPLSGVEPLLVREAFDRIIAGSSWSQTRLVIHEVALQAHCHGCGADFTLGSFRFQCPRCASTSVQITRGDQFRLLHVTINIDRAEEVAT